MRKMILALLVAACGLGCAPAFAVDGCAVLLCLSGAWRQAPQATTCVPPVLETFHQLALGHAFPTCDMSSSSDPHAAENNHAGNVWPTEATCPPMYSMYMPDEQGQHWVGCMFTGLIQVTINGAPWEDVFWNEAGSTSTRYYQPAIDALGPDGQLDPRYADDLAAYEASLPPPNDPGDPGNPNNER